MIEENKDCWLVNSCNHIDCDKFCVRRFKLNYLYDQALLSSFQRTHMELRLDEDETISDLEAFQFLKEVENEIERFINEGHNIYLHSQIAGNGKTSWSLRLLQAYFDKIWFKSDLECRALFINVPRFLLALKDNISDKSDYIQHIKDNILSADLVIWDDIGTKSTTSFESEHLLSMIDSRQGLGKSNIFTSNLSDDEMHQALGDRLSSRICNMSYDIELKGADKRCLLVKEK